MGQRKGGAAATSSLPPGATTLVTPPKNQACFSSRGTDWVYRTVSDGATVASVKDTFFAFIACCVVVAV